MVDYVLKSRRNVKYVRWDKDNSELRCASRCHKDKEGIESEGEKETEGEKENEGEKQTEVDNEIYVKKEKKVENETEVAKETNVEKEREREKENEEEKESEEREPCAWRIYCSYEAPMQKWMVKRYNDDHSCMTTGYCKLLSQEVIVRLFLNEIRDEPTLMPKRIQKEIHNRWHLIATSDQCRKTKKRALEIIQEEHDEQYSRMKDYRLELLNSNENSSVDLENFEGSNGLDIFYRFYVCFANIPDSLVYILKGKGKTTEDECEGPSQSTQNEVID